MKLTRPKVEYYSDYVTVPKTIQVPQIIKEKAIRMVPKETYETKFVAIQVPFQTKVLLFRLDNVLFAGSANNRSS